MLTGEEVKAVEKILAEELGVQPQQLTPSATLEADLGADSLTKVEIILALEEKFHVAIPDELAEGVETVEDVFNAAAKALGRAA